MENKLSPDDAIAMIYLIVFCSLSVAIIVSAWIMSLAVRSSLKNRSSLTEANINAVYGLIVFTSARNLAILNLLFYFLKISLSGIPARIIEDNLPAKTPELLLFLCLLSLIPTLMALWRKISQPIEAFFDGIAARRQPPTEEA